MKRVLLTYLISTQTTETEPRDKLQATYNLIYLDQPDMVKYDNLIYLDQPDMVKYDNNIIFQSSYFVL